MSKPYYFRIKEIADLNKRFPYWKLHQLGDLTINRKTLEVLIDAWLLPLTEPEIYQNRADHPKLAESRFYNVYEGVRVRIGVGQLPILLPGTIFRDGFPIEFPSYIKQTFQINPTNFNQNIVSMGSSWSSKGEDSSYYLPYAQHQYSPYLRTYSKSYKPVEPYPAKLLIVDFHDSEKPQISLDEYPLNQKAWSSEREKFSKSRKDTANIHGLIIPCIEMIRFYMTYSSQSCQQLLSGGLAGEPNKLFVTEKIIKPNADGSGGFLMLTKWVADDDRKVLVRAAFEEYALSQFRYPYLSALNNKIKEGFFMPEARFPFINEPTKLTVSGTYIQTKNRVYFLVYRINHCTARMAYKNAEWYRTNPGKKEPRQTEQDISLDAGILDENGSNVLGDTIDFEGEELTRVRAGERRGGQSHSDESPSEFRRSFLLSLGHDERFEHHKSNKLKPRLPKTDREIPSRKRAVNPFYTWDEAEEAISTAPSSGTQKTTPFKMLPETDRNYEDSPFDLSGKIREISNQPEEEFNSPQEMEKEQEDIESTESKYLPIDFNIFLEIIRITDETDKRISANVIYVPAKGNYYRMNLPTKFPSVYENQDKKRKRQLPTEVFIAELRQGNDYAYYIDIEAVLKKNTVVRSYKMFLVYSLLNRMKMTGEELRSLLRQCELNNGVWLKSENTISDNSESNQSTENVLEQNKYYRELFRWQSYLHTGKTAEDYAEKILEGLKDIDWIL